MFNSDTAPQYYLYLRSFETVPRSIAVEVTAPPVRDTAEIEAAIAKLDRELGGGPIVAPDGFTTVHQLLFIRLAQQHRLPASFVQEGAPIPVHGLTVAGTLLEPRKLAVIVALAAEMLAGSNAEALVTDALTRATGLAIDAALFDLEAADEVRAAGLRRGIGRRAPRPPPPPPIRR